MSDRMVGRHRISRVWMVAKKRWSLPIDARQALESGRKKVFYISGTEPPLLCARS